MDRMIVHRKLLLFKDDHLSPTLILLDLFNILIKVIIKA
jgi:hypothetical protein